MGWERWARLLLAVIAVAGLVAGLAGCGGGGGGSSSSSSARLTGVVQDQQTNQPISGATVQVGGHSTKTNDSGTFDLSVPAGTVSVTVSAPGYQSHSFPAVADEGQTNNMGVLPLLNADTNPPAPPV